MRKDLIEKISPEIRPTEHRSMQLDAAGRKWVRRSPCRLTGTPSNRRRVARVTAGGNSYRGAECGVLRALRKNQCRAFDRIGRRLTENSGHQREIVLCAWSNAGAVIRSALDAAQYIGGLGLEA